MGADDRDAAVRDGGFGRRRQEHPDRAAAARHQADLRRPAGVGGAHAAATAGSTTPTWRCSPTACAPSVSRASPSTSRTATSRRPKRKFIIADTPGHVQYTRNMVTGASTADLALVLIDARKGVLEQSRRHAVIASLLQVKHLVLCVNKMDLVEYAQERFDEICAEFTEFATKLEIDDLTFIPVSALHGDNITSHSPNMPWFEGPTLLHYLEHVYIASDRNLIDMRFPVQYVIRPMSHDHHDYRGYAGQVASGALRPGDEVVVLPSGFATTVAGVDVYGGPIDEAFPPMSVSVRLADEIDISRGDMLARPNNLPTVTQDVDAMVCWFSEQPLRPGATYLVKHTTRTAKARVQQLHYRLDINTLHRDEAARRAHAQRSRPHLDAHRGAVVRRRVPTQPDHRELHPDRRGHVRDRRRGDDPRPVGTLTVERGGELQRRLARERGSARRTLGAPPASRGATVWLTGLSGSGKSTVASALTALLTERGSAQLHARRRQPPPRPQRRSRLLRRRPGRERAPGRRGGAAVRRCRCGRARAAHQPVPRRARPRPRAARGGRAAVRRGVRRHADRGVRGPGPEGPVRQGPRRRDQGVHRHRRPVRTAACRRSSCSAKDRPRTVHAGSPSCSPPAARSPADSTHDSARPAAAKSTPHPSSTSG